MIEKNEMAVFESELDSFDAAVRKNARARVVAGTYIRPSESMREGVAEKNTRPTE